MRCGFRIGLVLPVIVLLIGGYIGLEMTGALR